MGFEETSVYVKEVHTARKQDQPMTDSQEETDTLNSIAFKELNTITNHMSLEVDPSLVKPSAENPTITDTIIITFWSI